MTPDTLTRPITKLLPRFVPVIFANGDDDDLPGLIAALTNEAVQFDETIYDPGVSIYVGGRPGERRYLRLRRAIRVEWANGDSLQFGLGSDLVVIRPVPSPRQLHFDHCTFNVQP